MTPPELNLEAEILSRFRRQTNLSNKYQIYRGFWRRKIVLRINLPANEQLVLDTFWRRKMPQLVAVAEAMNLCFYIQILVDGEICWLPWKVDRIS